MSEDKPPTELSVRKKAEKISLQIVQAIFVLISFFFLIVVVVGFGAWLSNIQSTSLLFGTVFFFVLLLISSFIVYASERALEEFRPRPKLNRDDIKQLGYASLPTVAIVALFYLLDYYFKLFPTTISANLSLEIFKILIQANGFLIGFAGIVFAQMFWAIHNQQSNIQKDILENPFTPDEKRAFDIREDYLTAFERKRGSMIRIMFVVVILFVVSILLSLGGMAQTETQPTLPTNPNLTNPFWCMTYGIFVFGVSIAQSKMDIREDVNKILLKRIKKLKEINTKLKAELSKKLKEEEELKEEINKKLKEAEENKKRLEKLSEEKERLTEAIEEKKKELASKSDKRSN